MPENNTARSESLTPLNVPLDKFLQPFFAANELVRLRVFDDRKQSSFKGAKMECAAGKITSIVDTLRRHNEQNRGIFFTINFGGHEDAEITRINAQFVECDTMSLEEQYAQMEAFPLPPSIIVKTAKSLHCYWLMRDAQVADFRRVQKRLVAQFHGDPMCVNESRVFRLPGFNHCKGDLVPVICVKFDPQLRYTQSELEAVLPVIPGESGSSTAKSDASAPPATNPRKGLPLVLHRCAFIKHCGEHAATLPESLWYAMIANLAVFDGGDSVIHDLSCDYPGYDRAETQTKMDHFRASGTKPITCAKIAEIGFTCPKMQDDSCACKSPASLCYKPADLDTLRALLEGVPVTGSVSDDLQTAQQFVRDYLYNVDGVLAAAFVDNELRGHFGFGKTDVRPLLALYKKTEQGL